MFNGCSKEFGQVKGRVVTQVLVIVRSMNLNVSNIPRVLSLLIGFLISAFALNTFANELSKSRDCTVIELEPEIDPNLTTEENIQKLTEQFFESVNTVQHCDVSTDAASSGGGGAAGGGAAGGGATGGGTTAASSDIAGTESVLTEPAEAPANLASDAELSAIQSEINEALQTSSGAEATGQQGATSAEAQDGNNGAIPDDIPPADNDSVFEAQIRAAAENETDPEVKKNLWNEYRKYKGLPIEE